MSDGDPGWKWMDVGKANSPFVDLTGQIHGPITTNAAGWAEWRCLGGSVSVWVEQELFMERGMVLD